MAHLLENASFKFHGLFFTQWLIQPFLIQNTLFESKFLSQGSIEQDHLLKNVKNLESNKIINFRTESVKKPTIAIHHLLFIITVYYLQNVNKLHSEIKIAPK